jgi:hypothetical protein
VLSAGDLIPRFTAGARSRAYGSGLRTGRGSTINARTGARLRRKEGQRMTKQEILDYFGDINEAYNDSSRFDSLAKMLDELMDEREINDKALQELVDLEIMVPCDEMSDQGDWCEENCHIMNNGPTKECWRRYLTMKE